MSYENNQIENESNCGCSEDEQETNIQAFEVNTSNPVPLVPCTNEIAAGSPTTRIRLKGIPTVGKYDGNMQQTTKITIFGAARRPSPKTSNTASIKGCEGPCSVNQTQNSDLEERHNSPGSRVVESPRNRVCFGPCRPDPQANILNHSDAHSQRVFPSDGPEDGTITYSQALEKDIIDAVGAQNKMVRLQRQITTSPHGMVFNETLMGACIVDQKQQQFQNMQPRLPPKEPCSRYQGSSPTSLQSEQSRLQQLCSRLETPQLRIQAPQSRLQTPQSRLQAPQSRLQAPQSRLEAPQSRLQAPQSRLEAPQSKLQTPQCRLQPPQSRLQHPQSRMQPPQSRLQPLESRLQAPQSRLQAPQSRLQPPGSRLQAPQSRVQAPQSRLEAPQSRMQGPQSRLQAAQSRLQAPQPRLQSPQERLQELSSNLQASKSRLQEIGSKLQAPRSRLQTPQSRLQPPSSRLQEPCSSLPASRSRLQEPQSRQAPCSSLQTSRSRLQEPQSRQAPCSSLQTSRSRLQEPQVRLQAPDSPKEKSIKVPTPVPDNTTDKPPEDVSLLNNSYIPKTTAEATIDHIKTLIEEEKRDVLQSQTLSPELASRLKHLKKKSLLEETLQETIPTLNGDVIEREEASSSATGSDVVASLMHSEERGVINTVSSPKRMYDALFGAAGALEVALDDERSVAVSPAAPSPLNDIVVPVGEATQDEVAVLMPEMEYQVAQTDQEIPKADAYSESVQQGQSPVVCPARRECSKRNATQLGADVSHIPRGELEEEMAPWDIDLGSLEDLVGGQLSMLSTGERLPSDESIRATLQRFEYILDVEKPKHYSCVQLRGTQRPPWFPGYYFVHPQNANTSILPQQSDNENYVRLEQDPSNVFAQVWNIFKPNNLRGNSEIVIL